MTSDLSVHGMFLETSRSLPSGTSVRLVFSLMRRGVEHRIVVDGQVQRVVPTFASSKGPRTLGMGIQFDSVIEGLPVLQDYVRDRLDRTRKLEDTASGVERRATPRIAAGLPVLWGTNPQPSEEGHLSDLSESSSFLVSTDAGVAVGTRIFLQFEIVDAGQPRQVRAVCRVVRTTSGGMGIVFDVASVDTEAIAHFVRERCR